MHSLLAELGCEPPGAEVLRDATRALIDDPTAGVLLLAEADGVLVGMLGASWQLALHVPGRYGLIQELWVDPAWRRRAVARELMDAFLQLARAQQIARVEVGLPCASFAGIRATEAFYRAGGFTELGTRMRRAATIEPAGAHQAAGDE